MRKKEINERAEVLKNFYSIIENCGMLYLSPGCATEIDGYLYDGRINRSYLPEGWYAYDIRHGDSGTPVTLENMVVVNFYGTFITNMTIPMLKGKAYRSTSGRGGYSFDSGERIPPRFLNIRRLNVDPCTIL